MNTKTQKEIAHKLPYVKNAVTSSNVASTYQYFGISKDTRYHSKLNYKHIGEQRLINSKSCQKKPKLHLPKLIEEKFLYLRKTFQAEKLHISWYLWCYLYHNFILSSLQSEVTLKSIANYFTKGSRFYNKYANFNPVRVIGYDNQTGGQNTVKDNPYTNPEKAEVTQ